MLAQRFLKHRTLCWSILDIKLSFLPCFCGMFADFYHEFVVFAMFLWDFWWFWAVARTVCGQFCGIFGGFFAVVGPLLHERCLSQVVPLCLVARNCTAEGYEPVFALLKCAFLRFFPQFLSFFPRRFEHGHFSCKGGRDMAGKIPTTFATSCNRLLWPSEMSRTRDPPSPPPSLSLPLPSLSPLSSLLDLLKPHIFSGKRKNSDYDADFWPN